MSIICGQIASGQENKRYFVLKLIFNCKTKSFIFDTDPLWKILRVARRNVTVGTLVVSNCTFFFSLYSFENSLQHSFSYCVSLVFRYCECFSAKQYCQDCNCEGCCNNEEHRALVEDAVAHVIERNPNAFLSKVETPVTILYHIFVHFRFNKRNFEWFWGHHFILIECYWLVFVSPDFLYRETTKDVIVEKQIASKNIVNVFKYIYIYIHTQIFATSIIYEMVYSLYQPPFVRLLSYRRALLVMRIVVVLIVKITKEVSKEAMQVRHYPLRMSMTSFDYTFFQSSFSYFDTQGWSVFTFCKTSKIEFKWASGINFILFSHFCQFVINFFVMSLRACPILTLQLTWFIKTNFSNAIQTIWQSIFYKTKKFYYSMCVRFSLF